METGLYKIKVRGQVEELENGGSVMLLGNGGMVFAEVHPVKIKATPKKSLEVEPMDVVRSIKSICSLMDCIDCPLRDWCLNLPVGGRPTEWRIPKKED